MPEFIRKLRKEVRVFFFSRTLLALMLGLMVWPALIYSLDLYDLFFPIMEKNAGDWLNGILTILILFTSGLLAYFYFRKPKARDLAQDVENPNYLIH